MIFIVTVLVLCWVGGPSGVLAAERLMPEELLEEAQKNGCTQVMVVTLNTVDYCASRW